MSDEQMFDQLWTELNKPLNQMRARIRQLSKLTPRAEVAGAVEVVDALPDAGKKGRLLYDDSADAVYVDLGSGWSPLGGVNDSYVCDEASDYTTTSTSFVDVDGTNLALTIITNGGPVLVHFHGMFYTNGARMWLDVDVDGTRTAGDDGIIGAWQTANFTVTFSRLITGLSAGEHTFTLQWKVISGGTAKLYAGAGTSNADVHPQFWVREVS